MFLPLDPTWPSPNKVLFPTLKEMNAVKAKEHSEMIVNIVSQATMHFDFRDDFLVIGSFETTSIYIGSKWNSGLL